MEKTVSEILPMAHRAFKITQYIIMLTLFVHFNNLKYCDMRINES
jgi:hypothetical protein